MVKKVLFISLGALILVLGFVVVAVLTKRSGLNPNLTQNFLPAPTPSSSSKFIASGRVLGAKKEINSLIIQFDSPPMFRGKTQDVEVACPAGESFINTLTFNIKAKKPPISTEPQPTNQLLFQIADPTKKDKDIITGTCASQSCTVINSSCILTRTIYIR